MILSCSKEEVIRKSPTSGPYINQPVDDDLERLITCDRYFFCLTEHNFRRVTNGVVPYVPGAYGAAASAGDKVFFGGGHEEGTWGLVQADVNILNTKANAWAYRYLSVPRSYLSAASAGNKVLFAGGANIVSLNQTNGIAPYWPLKYYDIVDIFDVEDYTQTYGTLSEARAYMASVSSEEKAFFIGGKTIYSKIIYGKIIDGFSSNMDIYDAESNQWSVVQMPRERAYAGAAISGGKIYIAGGQNAEGLFVLPFYNNLKSVDIYDIESNEWFESETPHEHPYGVAIALDGKVYVAGGDGKQNNSVDIYNTFTGEWSSAELSDSRYDMAVGTVDGKIIFFGGRLSQVNFSENVDVYDPSSNTWSVAKLISGASGVAVACVDRACFFTGLLYDNGNTIANQYIEILP